MNKDIDQLFKKALQEERCEPPVQAWQEIEKRLRDSKRSRWMPWWLRGAAAAALLLGLVGIWNLKHFPATESPYVQSELEIPASIFPSTVLKPVQSPDVTEVANITIIEKEEISAMSPSIVKEGVDITIRPSENKGRLFTDVNPTLNTRQLKQLLLPLVSGEAYRNVQAYHALLAQEAALLSSEEKEKKKLKVTLSGHLAPGYSTGNYYSSAVNPRGYSYSESQPEGMVNLSGGLRVAIATGKRFSVQTGLFFSRLGQKSTEKNRALPRMTTSTLTTAPHVTTPLGNIKYKSNAVQSSVYAKVVSPVMSSSIEQIFGALEIPLSVRYRLNNNKVGFYMTGGFSGSFLVENKVYQKSGDQREYLGSTEDIRHVNITTDFSLGIEYPLTNKIHFMLEPGIRYYLQSLSKESYIDFKPYTFSLSTGIGIRF